MDYQNWIEELKQRVQKTFHGRIYFLGIQGSVRRGEAKEQSDIDFVIILDTLSVTDLKLYREAVRTMPNSEKACGFISGKDELFAWPKAELFQFCQDTQALFGSLEKLMSQITRKDILEALYTQSASLYHTLCHTFVFEEKPEDFLRFCLKGAWFLLQAKICFDTDVYYDRKQAMAGKISGADQSILEIIMNEDLAEYQEAYRMLLDWCRSILIASKR